MWEIKKDVINEALVDIRLTIGNGRCKHDDLIEIKTKAEELVRTINEKLAKTEMTWADEE